MRPMIRYNSQVGEGRYCIQVETNVNVFYKTIEKVIRTCIDLNKCYELKEAKQANMDECTHNHTSG